MAVSDKISCSCGKSSKRKLDLSKGFLRYLQTDLHNELEDAKIQLFNCIKNILTWRCEQAHISLGILASTHKPEVRGCEDARIPTSTHEPGTMRMWRCKDTRKHTWIWEYEHARMRVYKLTIMTLRIWGCEDARIQASTVQLEDMRMQR